MVSMEGPLIQEAVLTIADERIVLDHPELHHYTTEVGLKGIVGSNCIRATHFADLNDATEVKLLRALENDDTSCYSRTSK
jgi:hypothetical protein